MAASLIPFYLCASILARFQLTRSQKRVLAKNRDIDVIVRPSFINREKQELFDKHRVRFDDNVPDSLFNFLSPNPAEIPCPNLELCVYLKGRLLGVTFLDIGEVSTSAIYAIFDPAETKRSLGILMILHSIEFSRKRNCRYYYPGYAYREPFTYDYKKRLGALEYLDWNNGWRPYPPSSRRFDERTQAGSQISRHADCRWPSFSSATLVR